MVKESKRRKHASLSYIVVLTNKLYHLLLEKSLLRATFCFKHNFYLKKQQKKKQKKTRDPQALMAI